MWLDTRRPATEWMASNGIVNVLTGETRAPSPDYGPTVRSTFDWQPEAAVPDMASIP